MAKKLRVGLFTYGNQRKSSPLNSVLLVHGAIRHGLLNDPDIELVDYTPPLINDHDIDRAAAAELWRRVEPGLDVAVCQAAVTLQVLGRLAEVAPNTVRMLHRDSSHARTHWRILKAQQERLGIHYPLHYDDPASLNGELREYDLADRVTVGSRWAWRSFAGDHFLTEADKGEIGRVSPTRLVHVGPQVIEVRRWRAPARRAGEQVFFFCGQLGLRKGILDLLEAWRMAGAPGRLVVAGQPDHEAVRAPIMTALEASPRTTYIPHIPMTRLAETYRATTCLVMPSHEEGAAMVCFEALASGCALIATEQAGCDLLAHDKTGQVVETGDPVGLAHAIKRYAEQDELRYTHAVRAASLVDQCDLPAYGARYAAAVKRTAAGETWQG